MKNRSVSPRAWRLTALIITVLILLIGLYFLREADLSSPLGSLYSSDSEEKPKVYLYTPDYETDIFTLPSFTGLNLYLTYANGGESFMVSEGTKNDFGPCVAFFHDYFDTLRHGDTDTLNALHTSRFFTDHTRYESITMQKLYDAKITYLSEQEVGRGVRYQFAVSYKIMRNDGTFRADLASDSALAQLYTLYADADGVLIDDIQAMPY